ncbi:MAG: NRDE family protein [Thermoguttaceae bacterium]
MCILALQYKTARDAPILVAANREEFRDRPTQPPRIQSGRPRVICGIDRKAGGTWLGVNQYGLVVAVANRPKAVVPAEPRSRGLLCREMLNFDIATKAADYAARQLATGRYAGANYLCADARTALVVHGGEAIRTVELGPGLHVLSENDVDDLTDERQELVRRLLTLQRLDSAVAFLAVASRTFSRKPDASGRRGVVLSGPDYGTVSSTLIALAKKTHNAVYLYAPGPPSECSYDDLSALLRQVLSTDK